MRRLLVGTVAVAAALVAAESRAAPVVEAVNKPTRGPAISQLFVGGDASFIQSASGAACVASKPIRIDESSYIEPDGQTRTPFEDIVRSRGASIQLVAPRADGAPFWRIQMKYPIRADRPMTLTIDGAAHDVSAALEASGDSLRLEQPELVAALRGALAGGLPAVLEAISSDTGRRVVDALPALGFEAFDACDSNADSLVDAPAPSLDISVAVAAPQVEANRVTLEQARICGMGDAEGALYRGRLRETTGFFAQTDKAVVAYSADGVVERVYVPGVFDARRTGDGGYMAAVSIAADSNDPLAPNAVKGCLGDDIAPMSFLSGDFDEIRLSPPIDRLLAGDRDGWLTPNAFLAGGDPVSAPAGVPQVGSFQAATPSRTLAHSLPNVNPGAVTPGPSSGPPSRSTGSQASNPDGGGSDGGDGGDGGSGGGGSDGGDGGSGGGGDVSSVPIPGSLALLLAGVAALVGFRRRA